MKIKFVLLSFLFILLVSLVYSTPKNIHLSWNGLNSSSTTMVVSWWTTTNTSSQGQVRYGTSSGNYTNTVSKNPTYSSQYSINTQSVRIDNLLPDTQYYYSCGNATDGWSTERTFRTGPAIGSTKSIKFAITSDNHNANDWATQVKNKIKAYNPMLAVYSGDLVNDGRQVDQWNGFLGSSTGGYEDFISSVPFFSATGNHDASDEEDFYANLDLFDWPKNSDGNERWYSFNYGNAHFIFLRLIQDNSTIPVGSAQYNWLQSDLQAADSNPDIRWKFVSFHAHPYCNTSAYGGHPRNTNILKTVCPLFDQYKVDLVFNGHSHVYERSKKMRNTTTANEGVVVEDGPNYDGTKEGTVYVEIGPAGNTPRSTTPAFYTAASKNNSQTYAVIDIDNANNKLTFSAYAHNTSNNTSSLTDSCTITKPAPSNPNIYYVDPSGSDSTSNDGSSSKPWKTLAYAVTKVPVGQGCTVHLNAGTYNETQQSVVPVGVNIEGTGVNSTIINSSYAGILLSLQSSSLTNGNQVISNLAIRGNNIVKEAIRVSKRHNVVMRELDIRDIAENGIILYGDDSTGYSNNLNIYNSSFSNISTNLPVGWFKYDQGAIRMHRIDGCEIRNVVITNLLSTQGGGIKFYLPNNPAVKNLKIHDCNIVSRYLDIELWSMSDGCEIYNNKFHGWLSLLGSGKGAKSYGLYIHDNTFIYSIENLYVVNGTDQGKYCIELTISDVIIERNYFEGYPQGAIDMWEYKTHNNITINNNIFYNQQWHAIFAGVPEGFNNFKIYNNVFHCSKGAAPALKMRFALGGTLNNVDIKNNIFMGDNLGNAVITREGTVSLTNAVFSNNLTYQINTDLTEFAQSNNLLNTNPQIKATGSRRDTYYQLNSISPCIDAGTNVGLSYNGTAPDIGRWESSYSSNLINVKNYGATGNGSTNDATSIQNAINDCPTGGTVYFPNGTYLLNSTLTLPVQKSLQGESKTGTILKGNHTNHMITGINTTHVNGNQSVYNFTIDGNHKSIGLDFWGRDNLNFYNLSITHMENAGGALFVHSTDNANDPQCSREHPPLFYINNVNISSCTFSDNNGGSIGLLGIDGGNIHNNTHNERNGSTGTGLTCWAQGWLKNVKIHDSTFSCWRDIELMNMIGGNEIYNCNFTGWVSIPDGGLASGFTYSLAVHDNVFSYIAAGCDTQHHALEAGNSDMLIYNNYFENYEAGIQMFATAPFNDNITIRNNVFYNIGGLYTYLATIGLGAGSASENNRQNIKILNNTFHVSGAYSPIVISGGTSSPKLTNCEIKNNIFYGNNTGTPVISRNGTAFTYTNCSFTNNLTYNLNNGDFSGFTQTSNKLSTNPLITGSGNKPTPYYTLQNGSPCI